MDNGMQGPIMLGSSPQGTLHFMIYIVSSGYVTFHDILMLRLDVFFEMDMAMLMVSAMSGRLGSGE
jgi:hypothetical protein